MGRQTKGQGSVLEFLENRIFMTVTLLNDPFNGANVNYTIWHQSKPGPDTYIGRTQFATTDGNLPAPTVSGGSLHMTVSNLNPTSNPANPSFAGQELISNESFQVQLGETLVFKMIAKFNSDIAPGLVLGFFPYVLTSGGHDEADIEVLSNFLFDRSQQIQSNLYTNEPLGAGLPRWHPLPLGGNLTGFHTYSIQINGGVFADGVYVTSPSTTWYIDNVIVRYEERVPTNAMQLHLNFWAPDAGWAEAFSSSIVPTVDSGEQQTFSADISSVLVQSVKNKIPLTVQGGSIHATSANVTIGAANFVQGTLHGSGKGAVKYQYQISLPTGTSILSSVRNTTMKNGTAALSKFKLPTGAIGDYAVKIRILQPQPSLTFSVDPATYIVGQPIVGINITQVPPYGINNKNLHLGGVVTGGNFAGQKVLVFLFTNGGWWSKPTYAHPATAIAANGKWSTEVNGDMFDYLATQYRAYLVPKSFDVPLAIGESYLPLQLDGYLYAEIFR